MVREIDLGPECIVIIERDPLILIPGDVLDRGRLVVVGPELVGFDDLLDLPVSESARIGATATRSSTALEIAARRMT